MCRAPLLIVLALLVAACAPSAANHESSSSARAEHHPLPPVGADSLARPAIEAELLMRLREARRDERLPALVVDDELTALARAHSAAMRERGFFGHDDPERGGFAARAGASGLLYTALAENVAYAENVEDPAAALHFYLMDSPDHRANRMNEDFREVGVGVVAEGGKVWVTELFRTPPPYPAYRPD